MPPFVLISNRYTKNSRIEEQQKKAAHITETYTINKSVIIHSKSHSTHFSNNQDKVRRDQPEVLPLRQAEFVRIEPGDVVLENFESASTG